MSKQLIPGQGHAGEVHGNIEVLSLYKSPDIYYVKILDKIGIMNYIDIISGVKPRDLVIRLNKNPYLHLIDGNTILFDVHGLEIKIDTVDFELIR